MNNSAGRRFAGLLLLVGILGSAGGEMLLAQETPAATAPATAPSDAPKVDDLLPKKKVAIDFSGKPIKDVLAYIGESYGLKVVNPFESDASTMNLQITMKLPEPQSAREAINLVNDTLLALGYSAVPTVKGDPPEVVLTVRQTARDGPVARVFYGNDPDKIPEGDEIRTQVITLKNLEPAAAKEAVAPILGRRADVTLDATAKTMIVTDTAGHIHTAAVLIQALEKQAGNAKAPPGVEKKE